MRLGRVVEARGQRGNLVLAFDRDARREVALAELLDPGLEPLQPAREPPRHRPGSDRNRDCQHHQGREQPGARTPGPVHQARHQHPPVGEREHPGGTARAALPAAFDPAGAGHRQRPAGGGDQHALAGIQRQIGAQPAMQLLEHRLLACAWRERRGKRMRGDLARELERLLEPRVVGPEPPHRHGSNREDHQDGDDRQVELQIEPPHLEHFRSSWISVLHISAL